MYHEFTAIRRREQPCCVRWWMGAILGSIITNKWGQEGAQKEHEIPTGWWSWARELLGMCGPGMERHSEQRCPARSCLAEST